MFRVFGAAIREVYEFFRLKGNVLQRKILNVINDSYNAGITAPGILSGFFLSFTEKTKKFITK